jgi:2-succinyl-5-enolpyruvyl-6-hydroxy-3-cyclohexene-1-carboxylate synthase
LKNRKLAEGILLSLARSGVAEICVCAGRRDAPLLVLLEHGCGFRVHSFFEERSAAFFALGRAKRTDRPVAIVTTSGTACAELLPALIEAFYSGHRLVAVTADRPRRLRGSGAPQTIEQLDIFGGYVRRCLDIEAGEELPSDFGVAEGSVHLNVRFDEPLTEPAGESVRCTIAAPAHRREAAPEIGARLERFLAGVARPLVVVGPVPARARGAVGRFVGALGLPAFLESTSGLRGEPLLGGLELRGGNGPVAHLLRQGTFDSVVRIGGVPAARFWRDLDEKLRSVPVLSIASLPFRGLERGEVIVTPLEDLPPPTSLNRSGDFQELLETDRQLESAVIACAESEPASEVALIRELSRRIPGDAALYLGNSLPIREWDLAAVRGPAHREVEANRGANGIDGQLSTFFGWSFDACERWCVLGDLTTLYDLSAPASAPADGRIRIVVINNGGGQIFRRMFSEKIFRNEHRVSFAGWAAMWGFEYIVVDRVTGWFGELPDRVIIEVRPEEAASDRFWGAYDRALSSA